ncbi:MAG: phosphate signaling complex protein PhoU [Lachnospiraceae bacterium]|nr:phosphate signaling complex protein PhoU [Candidatus Fimimorpha excrementavium]
MRQQLDKQLNRLHVELIKMGSLCEKAISLSAKLLVQRSDSIMREVFAVDSEIDTKEKELESFCMMLLLQQQPVAKDFREVSAALKMVSDLERIGDQAADIADLSRYIKGETVHGLLHINDMASATVKMVTESVDAFVKADLLLARKVMEDDDIVDELFNRVRGELIQMIQVKQIEAETAIDLLMAAKYLERIGDHAVNLAEWVEYSITGARKNNEHQQNMW